MNDLDRELQERERKVDLYEHEYKKWNDCPIVYNYENKEYKLEGITNNKIKPNLIKHNNSRFQKLLIIRINKNKVSKGL